MESDQIKQYMREIGRRGGRSRSEAKVAAVRENAKKANAARWKRKPLTTAADPPKIPLELGPKRPRR